MQLFIGTEIDNLTLQLTEDESWHCVKVLRKKNGDLLSVIDGLGHLYSAKIINNNPKKVHLEVITKEKMPLKRDYYLHLAIAPTKNIDRIEWFVEKAVEIGVDEISLLLCKNSERKAIKIERIQKIIESAIKQSIQFYLPKLNDLVAYEKFVKLKEGKSSCYIAHCNTPDLPFLGNKILKGSNSLVMIGPEGDFSVEEVNSAKSVGFEEIGLGNNRLRTETAALFAVNTFAINAF